MHPETGVLDGIQIKFPPRVYSDVRLERMWQTRIHIRDGELDEVLSREETGALSRVYKNGRWYYASTTDLDTLDAALASLASSEALTAGGIADVDLLLQPHHARVLNFDDEPVSRVPMADKLAMLRSHIEVLSHPLIRTWSAYWIDETRLRRFVSSRGANVVHDYQEVGFSYRFTLADGSETLTETYRAGAHSFSALAEAQAEHRQGLIDQIERSVRFVQQAKAVEAGTYRVILSPEVAGVFAHESFGHKSEADFMLGDPAMLDAWPIGSQVGAELLSIVDDGNHVGPGYVPYDDEGQPAQKTYLVKNGKLTGRLHAAPTAAALDEACTGNARALSFRFEPIVRMTTTYIEPGTLTREALFEGVEDGYFIESCKHGSGMSTFTIAPSLAWRIRKGKVAEPVRIAVLTGSVLETLGEIDGLSDEIELPFIVGGGCGKFEQSPLAVGFGGPYVRIAKMNVA